MCLALKVTDVVFLTSAVPGNGCDVTRDQMTLEMGHCSRCPGLGPEIDTKTRSSLGRKDSGRD